MEQRPPRVPKVTWGKEEEESPGGALTQETEELVPFQPAQEGAAMDWTQEQEPTSGLFHRTLKDKTSTMGTGSMENCDVYSTNTSAALLDILVEEGLPNPKQDDSQVQLGSMTDFQEMMDLLMEEERKALKSHVCQSLFPLSFQCHDENLGVAEASRETLLCAAKFVKRRDIEQMLQVDKTRRFGEGLDTLIIDTSNALAAPGSSWGYACLSIA
ncbi:uncharacterized protein LOC117006965 isoform X1 [Catharus ustulatus]|uniref:uncharacterized protein LOC117006965 isoform X1 n=1 Tax=Catharus ustulatus TaxID=91951 RepID=UPI00140D02F8|nr:uncharacterized protein LOC117006965 isoform X1 [Catharus ustulatus]